MDFVIAIFIIVVVFGVGFALAVLADTEPPSPKVGENHTISPEVKESERVSKRYDLTKKLELEVSDLRKALEKSDKNAEEFSKQTTSHIKTLQQRLYYLETKEQGEKLAKELQEAKGLPDGHVIYGFDGKIREEYFYNGIDALVQGYFPAKKYTLDEARAELHEEYARQYKIAKNQKTKKNTNKKVRS